MRQPLSGSHVDGEAGPPTPDRSEQDEIASTGVGVLDKCVAVLLAVRSGARSPAGIAAVTGLSRPTAHRLGAALEAHELLVRDQAGALTIGPLAGRLAAEQAAEVMVSWAGSILTGLRDATGETAQLFRRQGEQRLCVAAAEGTGGLRDMVLAGAVLSMAGGSSAQVLLAWESGAAARPVAEARFSADDLARVRRRGWAESIGQRETGLSSVSAPVRSRGLVIGSICVAGPSQRLGPRPGDALAALVVDAADRLSERVAAATGHLD